MKIVFETGGANPFTEATTKQLITLAQSTGLGKLFRVTYGLQVDSFLTYAEACAKLGQAILHHACCEGLADNSGD